MQDFDELKNFISKHSKFTDTAIDEIHIVNTNRKENIVMLISSEYENYGVKITFEDVVEMNLSHTQIFSIWELDLEYKNDLYVFDPDPDPDPTFTEGGSIRIQCKKIQMIEL